MPIIVFSPIPSGPSFFQTRSKIMKKATIYARSPKGVQNAGVQVVTADGGEIGVVE
jgi:hypothetical protein